MTTKQVIERRADSVKPMLNLFARNEGLLQDNQETIIIYFLANLFHYCNKMNIDIDSALDSARGFHDSEVKEL